MAELQSRVMQAEWIRSSAERLVKFCALPNPVDFLIEAERQILMRRLMEFPVNAECQRLYLEQRLEAREAEQAHLIKTGFYQDVADELDAAGDLPDFHPV